jgi:hypothetical protein
VIWWADQVTNQLLTCLSDVCCRACGTVVEVSVSMNLLRLDWHGCVLSACGVLVQFNHACWWVLKDARGPWLIWEQEK